jgi:hypothetical protein
MLREGLLNVTFNIFFHILFHSLSDHLFESGLAGAGLVVLCVPRAPRSLPLPPLSLMLKEREVTSFEQCCGECTNTRMVVSSLLIRADDAVGRSLLYGCLTRLFERSEMILRVPLWANWRL